MTKLKIIIVFTIIIGTLMLFKVNPIIISAVIHGFVNQFMNHLRKQREKG